MIAFPAAMLIFAIPVAAPAFMTVIANPPAIASPCNKICTVDLLRASVHGGADAASSRSRAGIGYQPTPSVRASWLSCRGVWLGCAGSAANPPEQA